MKRLTVLGFVLCAATALATASHAAQSANLPTRLPAPVIDATPDRTAVRRASTVFAGGCFWGVQGIFEHVRGVVATRAGFDGGARDTAQYDAVSGGDTGHAESVEVVYDPTQISYGTLLRIFFSVALDPTQIDQQYPDSGPQYRSVLYTRTAAQARIANAYIAQLNTGHVFGRPIATKVAPDHGFYSAEPEHQNFAALYPDHPYIATYDAPRLKALAALFGTYYRSQPVLQLAQADPMLRN